MDFIVKFVVIFICIYFVVIYICIYILGNFIDYDEDFLWLVSKILYEI